MKTIYYYTTSIGLIGIESIDEIITHIYFNKVNVKIKETDIKRKCIKQINEYLNNERDTFSVPFRLEGTPFQKEVWKILCTIKYGETYTYLQIAKLLNKEKSVRAIANAIGKNPVPLLIGCHRVIRSDGSIGGYIGGRIIKEKLIQLEENK